MKIKKMKIGKRMIEYSVKGEGEDIVFIHGLGSSLRTWRRTVNIVSKDFKCWCISLPEYLPYEIDGYSKIIRGFLKKKKIKKPFIVAHSLGTLVSIDVAEETEVRKMILVSAPLAKTNKKGLKKLISVLDEKIDEGGFFKDFSSWTLSRISLTKEQMKRSSIESLSEAAKDVITSDLPFDFSKLNMDEEFILVYGNRDKMLKILHSLDLYEEIGAENVIILDADHFIPSKNYIELAEIIREEFMEKPGTLEFLIEFIVGGLDQIFGSITGE